jgi:hypothetical protein
MAATSFVALYRGESVSAARLIAVSADPDLVADVTARLLQAGPPDAEDPAVRTLERGRRAALRLIRREVEHGSSA